RAQPRDSLWRTDGLTGTTISERPNPGNANRATRDAAARGLAQGFTLDQTTTEHRQEAHHASDRGGPVRHEEAGGGGRRGAARARPQRGARAVEGQRLLPQRSARDHGRLSPSPARGARPRGGGGGREGRPGRG